MASHSSKVNSVTTVLNVWSQSCYITLRFMRLVLAGLPHTMFQSQSWTGKLFFCEGKRKRDVVDLYLRYISISDSRTPLALISSSVRSRRLWKRVEAVGFSSAALSSSILSLPRSLNLHSGRSSQFLEPKGGQALTTRNSCVSSLPPAHPLHVWMISLLESFVRA